MGKKTFFVVFLVVVFAAQGFADDEGLSWHLALIQDGEGLSFDNPVTMRNGEKFSIELFVESDCYAYLVIEQASGSLAAVFARQMRGGSSQRVGPITLGTPSGEEVFYVVTSVEPQTTLQTAITNYNQDKSTDNAGRLRQALEAVGRRDSRRPGIPVALAGTTRGDEDSVQATLFSGASVYRKTITIRH
jgi:hypothetical protein